MTCTEAQDTLMNGSSTLELSWDAFEEHLSGCPCCEARLESTRHIRDLLRDRCRSLTAPPSLWSRILQGLPHRAA